MTPAEFLALFGNQSDWVSQILRMLPLGWLAGLVALVAMVAARR